MKNRKGFTLVELMAVIVILAVIIAIAVPTFGNVQKSIEKKNYENQISLIETAAAKYFEDNNITSMYVDDLIKSGYLEADDKNGKIFATNDKTKELKYIQVLNYKRHENVYRDKTKIVIISKCKDSFRYGGVYIYNTLLNEYGIQLEMKSSKYALAMTSICDTKEGIERLLVALVTIDSRLKEKCHKNVDNSVDNVDNFCVEKCSNYGDWYELPIVSKSYSLYPPKKAQELLITQIKLEDSVDKISGEYMYLYPPDIPLIVPGEIITQEFINIIKEYKKRGLNIEGLEDLNCEYINVIDIDK